jgi:hypothetical protein
MTECPNCHAVLPQPPDRFCPSCGTDLSAAGPAAGSPPPGYPPPPAYPPPGYAPPGGPPPAFGAPPSAAGTPWESRGQIGFLTAFVETTKQVLFEPARFFAAMRVTGGLGGPLLYAVLVGMIGLVASAIYSSVFRGVLSENLARMGGTSQMAWLGPLLQGGSVVVTLLLGPVIIAVRVFIGSGIIHLALLAMGAARSGYEATFRVTAYSHAPSLFSIVPVCGGLVEAIYTIVLLIIGISEAHGISRGKAAAAVLLPGLLLCCCCAGGIGILAFVFAGALKNMQ